MGQIFGVDVSNIKMKEVLYTREDFNVLLTMLGKNSHLYSWWNSALEYWDKNFEEWNIAEFRKSVCKDESYVERIIFWISFEDLPLFMNVKCDRKGFLDDILNVYIPWRFKIGK